MEYRFILAVYSGDHFFKWSFFFDDIYEKYRYKYIYRLIAIN